MTRPNGRGSTLTISVVEELTTAMEVTAKAEVTVETVASTAMTLDVVVIFATGTSIRIRESAILPRQRAGTARRRGMIRGAGLS